MRLFKSAGLVLGLALVVTAFLAVGSAAAETTKLCKANEEKCSKENTWALGFENFKGAIGSSPEGAKLVMPGLLTVECPTGKLASTLKETAGPLSGEVSKWNMSGCAPSGCTLTPPKEEETGYSAEVEATGGGEGILTVGLGPKLIAKCAGVGVPKVTCTYTAATMKFNVKGGPGEEGKNPQISSAAPMTRVTGESSLPCPATASFVSLYGVVEPGTSMFVTH